MRASFNHLQGRSYLIASARGALVDLPDLDAGVYAVVLYAHMQEVSKLPQALPVLPLSPVPTVAVRVAGTVKGFTADRLQSVKAGDKFTSTVTGAVIAEVESIGQAIPSSITLKAGPTVLHLPLTGQTDIPAVLKLQCFVASNSDGSLKCSV